MIVNLTFAFRRKSKSVLIARLFGDPGIEFFKCIALRAVVDVSARVIGIVDQAIELAVEIGGAGGHTVDANIGAKKGCQSFIVAVVVELCAILPIANQQNYFAAVARAVAQ